MRNQLGILFCFIAIIPLHSQSIYTKLNQNNFKNYQPFNEKIDVNNFKDTLLNAAIFYLTNEIRIKNNLSELEYCSALEKSAKLHSEMMVKNDFFSHTNKYNRKLKEPDDRARAVGISNPYLAENIVEGFLYAYKSGDKVTPAGPGIFLIPNTNKRLEAHTYLSLAQELLSIWMNSPGHKKNILAPDALQLGCGSKSYLIEDFNSMPGVKVTQNFQWFEKVITK